MSDGLDPETVRAAVTRALAEDLGAVGDITTEAVVAAGRRSIARIVARSELVLAGLPVAREVFRAVDPALCFTPRAADGDRMPVGACVAEVAGDSSSLLTAERTALNFLMRMSGIATAARRAVDEVADTGVRILDTRKTAPGLRHLDKYSVRAGGAANHRMGLYDGILIKDTHLGSGLTVGEAVRRARARGHPPAGITAEARTLAELDEAIDAGAGRVLLDNMDPVLLREAVRRARGRAELEASGGLRPGALREVALSGVDCLSLGWLTHSAAAADFALEMEPRT